MKFNLYNIGNDYPQSGYVRKSSDPDPIPPAPTDDTPLRPDGTKYKTVVINGKKWLAEDYCNILNGMVENKDYGKNTTATASVLNGSLSYSLNAVQQIDASLKGTGWHIPSTDEWITMLIDSGLTLGSDDYYHDATTIIDYRATVIPSINLNVYYRWSMSNGDLTTPIGTDNYAAYWTSDYTNITEMFVQGPNNGTGITFRPKNSYGKTIRLVHD